VRVYCGVATAELAPWLTVAVVDDSGRLLEVRHVGDDPGGYASLVALFAGRTNGQCPVAVDHPQHFVAQLLAVADRPLALVDEASVLDFSDRFADDTSYEETQAPASQRRAVGLARALQAGALSATAQSPGWGLAELKPVLSAHAALVAGRQAAAVALREVLRELYPAALRAYLDPAELIPLCVLEAFPEPGLLTSTQAVQAVIGDLAASGITDATTAANAVTALRVAADESRGRGNPHRAAAVAETVRQAVAAVRACDAATSALVASLADGLATAHTSPAPAYPTTAPVSPAVTRAAAPEWAAAGGGVAATAAAAMAAAHSVAAPAGPSAYGIPAPRSDSDPGRSGWPDVPAHASAAAAAAAAGYRPAQNGHGNGNGNGGASHAAAPPAGDWEQRFGPAPTSAAPYGPDTLSFSTDPLTAPMAPAGGRPEARGAEPASGDDDLLIFSEANSAWFTTSDDDTEITWTNLSSDDGWRAAAQIADPSAGPETQAGLPRRVPQANLVPGSATASGPARAPRIVRDARRIAAHTDGYFRGWRRGQEVGGFAVGQRDRAAWEFNREQRAHQGAARLS